MPQDKKAGTSLMQTRKLAKQKPAKDSDEEPEGHDPYNKAPDAENTESKDED